MQPCYLSVDALLSSRHICTVSSVFLIALWWMLEQSTALPWSKSKFACASMLLFGAMSSPRTVPDCFNHRALGLSPRSPIWSARVSGYLKRNHRRTALRCPKAKTPQNVLWSWLLARATTSDWGESKVRLSSDKTTQYSAGFNDSPLSPRCHSRRFGLYMVLLSCKPLWSQIF